MEMLQGVWKQHLRPRAVVGYGVKTFLPSPPNYVTRSPGSYLALTYKLTFFLLSVILRGVSSLQRSAEGFRYSLSINVCHWTVSLHISVRHWAARQLRTSSAGVET